MLQHNVLKWNNRRLELSNMYTQYNPDIILLNSHGNTDTQNIKLYTYNVHQKNMTQTNSDGVAIAVKHNITHTPIDNLTDDILAIKIQTQQGPLIIATIYLPPRRPFLPLPGLNNLLRHNIPIYIIGDFNARHRTFGYTTHNTVGNALVQLINRRRLTHLGPDFPTYIRANLSSTPDIVLCNHLAHHNIHMRQGDISTSDHLPIVIRISTNPIQIPTPSRRKFNNADWEGFKQHLLATPHPPIPPPDHHPPTHIIDEHLEQWYTDIQTATDAHIPTTTYRTLPHYKDNHQLRTLKIQYAHIQQYAQIHGWDRGLRTQYRHVQRQLQQANNELHAHTWSTLTSKLCTNINNPKDFFLAYRKLMGSTTTPHTYILNSNNEKLYTLEDMEAEHRHFWAQNFQITPQENTQFDAQTEQDVTTYLQQHQHLITPTDTIDLNNLDPHSPLCKPITTDEINWAIQHTKRRAPGPSGINKDILHNTPPNMRHRLKNIFNMSLSSGLWPKKFKYAHVRLIPKPGKSPHHVENSRPISLLETPGKLLELILNRRLRNHMEDNDTHNTRQYGFRPHRGTEQAIALAHEEVAQNLATHKQTNIILRDVAKAFDKVWHPGLMYKLLHLNLTTPLTRLLCNFLVDRTASIKLNTYIGPPIPLHSGTPQGSILSPTKYITYTHDLPPPTPYSNYIMYADDITQIVSHPSKSKEIMKRATQRAINHINTYENKWKIKTNTQKFQIIPIARQNPPPLPINNTNIPYTREGKLLGLTVTPTGMTKHIEQRVAQAKRTMTKLQRFTPCTTQTKLKLYTSIVRPVLEYPPIPLHTASNNQLQKLQAVQNKALRWATNTTYPTRITNEQLHNTLNMQPINIRLHNRAKNIWAKLEAQEDPLYTQIMETHTDIETRDDIRTHRLWRRSLPVTTQQHSPPPFYKRPPPQRRRQRPQIHPQHSDTDTNTDTDTDIDPDDL